MLRRSDPPGMTPVSCCLACLVDIIYYVVDNSQKWIWAIRYGSTRPPSRVVRVASSVSIYIKRS